MNVGNDEARNKNNVHDVIYSYGLMSKRDTFFDDRTESERPMTDFEFHLIFAVGWLSGVFSGWWWFGRKFK